MPTRVRSYSKINLGLAIGPVRADGFHALATLYQTLALHDVVTVEARPLGTSIGRDTCEPVTVTTNHPGVPVDARNTVWAMVERALERAGRHGEVHVHIQKDLPVQGGLGAGSANAAAALLGLERELGLVLPAAERLALAAEVGSDVPLFLIGGTVLGAGRGELVQAMPDLPRTPCVIAVPGVGVSTPRAFRDWDERHGAGNAGLGCGLTSAGELDRLEELSRVYASRLGSPSPMQDAVPGTSGIVGGSGSGKAEAYAPNQTSSSESATTATGRESIHHDRAEDSQASLLALVRTGIENDFEEVVFPQYPLLREIKRELMGVHSGSPAMYAALSGSGSALFGLYHSRNDAMAAQARVQASGCRALVTETLPRSEYWQTMFAE